MNLGGYAANLGGYAAEGARAVRLLIDRVTAAGLPVEFRVSGTPRSLPHIARNLRGKGA